VTSRESLVEAAVTAWRARDASGTIQPHPAWADLDAAGRSEAYAATLQARALEAALAADGLTTTGRAVLARIRSAGIRRRSP
jgi:hypothetical protein